MCSAQPEISISNGSLSANRQTQSATPAPRGEKLYGYGSAPPPQPSDHPLWTNEVIPSALHPKHRIFCNRALNMKAIKAVGFDMDYTLAQYRPETFEALAHKETVDKLVRHFRYPEELRTLTFQWEYMVKGLIIDKKRGNILKVDRHRYVKVAYHGFQPLSNDARKRTYNSTSHQELTFDEPDYAMVDTLFSLAEAYLFMQLVELKSKYTAAGSRQAEEAMVVGKSYQELYRDLRTAVDMCHRDGSLKRAVAAAPHEFIHRDPLLLSTLEMLRQSGRKLFLATNSLWDYTNVVMNSLLLGRTGSSKSTEWLKYFDVVMVGCGKPSFFSSRNQLFSVDVKTGFLRNTDNGAPILPVDELDLATPPPPPTSTPSSSNGRGGGGSEEAAAHVASSHSGSGGCSTSGSGEALADRVFQGGCYTDLHTMLNVRSGEEILYVGDHIYGDIVKSKKSIGWRTMLVIPELDVELSLQARSKRVYQELRLLRNQRDMIDDQIQRYEWALRHDQGMQQEKPLDYAKNLRLLESLRSQRDTLKARHSSLLADHHREFHPVWGQLLKTGHQNSRFAHQIERFACLYTSHVSNMAFYSPDKSFMGRLDYMAHETPFADDNLF